MNPTNPKKRYNPEFKAQAIELLALGRPVAENAAAEDLRSLRRENSLIKTENDILKKAAVMLGTKLQLHYGR
jgi:transposase-like protein